MNHCKCCSEYKEIAEIHCKPQNDEILRLEKNIERARKVFFRVWQKYCGWCCGKTVHGKSCKEMRRALGYLNNEGSSRC